MGGVGFVSDDMPVPAKRITGERGVEYPMLRNLDLVVDGRYPPALPVCALAEVDPRHGVARPQHRVGVPVDGDSFIVGPGQRIFVFRLVTDHGAVVVLEANLPPAHISAEEGDVAAVGYE